MAFQYDTKTQIALEATLPPDRLTAYMAATNNDLEKALKLYTWNSALSSAFYGPLQGLEVALRNSMHRELSRAYGLNWYDNPSTSLTPQTMERIDSVKENLKRSKKPIDPPHIVAELSFGFWIALLGKGPKDSYSQKLWRPILYKAFPHAKLSRKQAHFPLNYLRFFRNRIAHHEPIFNRALNKDYSNILKTTGWICTETEKWIKHHSRVENVLNGNGRAFSSMISRLRAVFKETF